MDSEKVIKVNARGLSNPGPRLMVETALEKGPCKLMRVIVSSQEAVSDLELYFKSHNARVDIDRVGEEYHILADFPASAKNT
ncbi:MAG: sulfurtransferase TusA family protein [Candidatus Latescibacterota bacterium]